MAKTRNNIKRIVPRQAIYGMPAHVFQQAVEQADAAISITDAEANILYVNPSFCKVTGYSVDEACGRNESFLSNKTTPDDLYRSMWQTIAGGASWHGHLVNLRKDGAKYLAELTITPVLDSGGKVTHYLGMHRDVTEMYRLECQVKNQKALIESMVDAAPLAIALLDEHDRVVVDNHEYKKLMGDLGMVEPAGVLLAAVRAEISDEQDKNSGFAFLDREVRIERPGWRSPRWFSCSGVWVQEDDGRVDAFFAQQNVRHLLLVAKEVTSQRTQQETVRMATLQAVLAEEDRIAGLRESLSAAVFQLEGPVNMIASAVGMLSHRLDREGAKPMADVLQNAVHSGEAALEGLRAIIPPPSREKLGSVNLNELLRDILDLVTGQLLATGITVLWQPQLVLPSVQACPNRLRVMFKALIDNAIEAMNTKGWQERELRIATRAYDSAGHLAAHTIEVIIEDSGPGIPAKLRLKVFEPFFSTKKDGGRHLGTGLATAQQVVADHSGLIEIDPARESGGCRITVSLPANG